MFINKHYELEKFIPYFKPTQVNKNMYNMIYKGLMDNQRKGTRQKEGATIYFKYRT